MRKWKPYYDFSDFLNNTFPFKVQKISVNAGFTCPNRDGSKGYGGCTYCNNRTFNPARGETVKSIPVQLEEGIRFFAYKYPSMKYLAYFQSYTNTYADLETLRRKYEDALAFPGVVGLIIGTRPDCMPDKLLDYLSELARKTFVLVEYGVESTSDDTLQRINRGHDYRTSAETIRRTHARGIYAGAHLILGLPDESRGQILHHADIISELPLTSLKLHQLQIVRHTAMGHEFTAHPERFRLFTPEEYTELVIDFMERLNPAIAVERFISQSPKELLIAPAWGLKNHVFRALVDKRFAERNTRQGSRSAAGCCKNAAKDTTPNEDNVTNIS
ncbi:MAG: TIGR01212 family radical SAM protein [Tannerella sp.]|jgi:radical SAM protein (TIGR01212 family)|nr:TIGR01212 family radical SAM protein [Tannerella sp.]